MAIDLLGYKQHYSGLSTDTKPTSGVFNGSVFHETDTSRKYMFDSSTSLWYPDGLSVISDNGSFVNVQNPFCVDGDSIYYKDINVSGSDIGNFSGEITDLFDDISTSIVDETANDPKVLIIKLKRPLDSGLLRLCAGSGGTFSNVNVVLQGPSGNDVGGVDDSSNNTKYNEYEYAYPPVAFCTIRLEFHTSDPIQLNFIYIAKTIHSHSQLLALKPDSTATFIDATTSGNLKVSVEEGDNEGSPVFVKQQDIDAFTVGIEGENVTGDSDYILIDLSDTTNFPHEETGLVCVRSFKVSLNPSSAFQGDIEVGYLKNVDGTNGDFVELFAWHMDQSADQINNGENFAPSCIRCSDLYHVGNTYADDAAFNTGASLTSPIGTSPAGNGDLALKIKVTAGAIDFSLFFVYMTEA